MGIFIADTSSPTIIPNAKLVKASYVRDVFKGSAGTSGKIGNGNLDLVVADETGNTTEFEVVIKAAVAMTNDEAIAVLKTLPAKFTTGDVTLSALGNEFKKVEEETTGVITGGGATGAGSISGGGAAVGGEG